MCGRFTITTAPERWVELLDVGLWPEDAKPRFNIAPTQNVVCIRQNGASRESCMMRWGLVPSWANDLKVGARMINARSESAAEKPSFRTALKKRRCLIPADGFFEWEKLDRRTKQPWLIHFRSHTPFVFAGLWESWQPPDKEQPVLSCSILTTASNMEMAEIHDRMPVVIEPQHYAAWLSSEASVGQVQGLMSGVPDGSWDRFPVNPIVGNVRNDVPECIQSIQQT